MPYRANDEYCVKFKPNPETNLMEVIALVERQFPEPKAVRE